MIVAGTTTLFAIEAQVQEVTKGWILGHIRFTFHSLECGNWNDTVDLKGCVAWLRDFAEKPVDRRQPALMSRPKEEVCEALAHAALGSLHPSESSAVTDAYRRFYISHLGMSAFDRVDMWLMEDETAQRCLWRKRDEGVVHESCFPPKHMQQIAAEFCAHFENTYRAEMATSKR